MANFLESVLQSIKKLTGREGRAVAEMPTDSGERPRTGNSAPETPEVDESALRALSDSDLRATICGRPEKNLVRLLQGIRDSELQLRIVQSLSDEGTLKRVARSELGKRIKRAAEKKLREAGLSEDQVRLRSVGELSGRMEAFLREPDWREARSLLSVASDPAHVDIPRSDSSETLSAAFTHFQVLRNRLEREVHEYERTVTELEDICEKLESSRALSKPALSGLQERWNELGGKYAFPESLRLKERYESLLARHLPRVPSPPKPDLSAQNAAREKARIKAEKQVRRQEEAKIRATALEALLKSLHEIEGQLGGRHTAQKLRKLQADVAALKQWKGEFPEKFEEAEGLLKGFLSRNREAVNEAHWDSWARTDRASRILAEFEALVGRLEALETQGDADATLKEAAGLGDRLITYTREMKELGHLENDKDREIWEKFKALCDRGWSLGERLRSLAFERLKALLSEQASAPIDFTLKALMDPKAKIAFKPSALEESVSSRVYALRSLWREIGARKTEASQEMDAIFTRLFEHYFGALNRHVGNIKKAESRVLELKREVVREARVNAESKASLQARVKVAGTLAERWKKIPVPVETEAALQAEFDRYQAQLNAAVAEELEKQAGLAEQWEMELGLAAENIAGRTGAQLLQAMKALARVEGELASQEKNLASFGPSRLGGIRERLRGRIQEQRTAIQKEIFGRSAERARLLLEAEGLAVSTNWQESRARLEELRSLWSRVGALGQSQDALYDYLFEGSCRFFAARAEGAGQEAPQGALEKVRNTRKELICAIEALSRFQEGKAKGAKVRPALELPFPEEERARLSGKILEAGMRYQQILSLGKSGDSSAGSGLIRETRKIVEQWTQLRGPDVEMLDEKWAFFLDRVHTLFDLSLDL